MRVVPEDQGGPGIDEPVGEVDLLGRRVVGHLRPPPVQRDGDMVAPAFEGDDIPEDFLLDQPVDRDLTRYGEFADRIARKPDRDAVPLEDDRFLPVFGRRSADGDDPPPSLERVQSVPESLDPPESPEWLFATLMTSNPASFRYRAASGHVKITWCFSTGSPVSERVVSRFPKRTSLPSRR